jgi:hypothetical protein
MGIITCKKHGTHPILFGCPHVREALNTRSTWPQIVHRGDTAADDPVLEGFALGGWFCDACIPEHALPPDGTGLSDPDAFLERTATLYQPMCKGCFSDWKGDARKSE